MRVVREPRVYLVGRQVVDEGAVRAFLEDNDTSWSTETEIGAEKLSEMAGRVCYMSFGAKQGRKSNTEYMENIIESGHGSVLEHGVWNFVIAGVSRSLTHELIRHRAGWGYSQLSQRYVDESTADFVEPDVIAEDPEAHRIWLEAVEASHQAYLRAGGAGLHPGRGAAPRVEPDRQAQDGPTVGPKRVAERHGDQDLRHRQRPGPAPLHRAAGQRSRRAGDPEGGGRCCSRSCRWRRRTSLTTSGWSGCPMAAWAPPAAIARCRSLRGAPPALAASCARTPHALGR